MRTGSHPVVVGLPENPWPGSEGITTWKASASVPPCAVGSVSGSMIFSCSMIEPGQPCVTISGQRVLVPRADVDEVDVQPVDLGHEVRQGVQPRLAPAPVVVGRPVARELLHGRELHALRVVVDRLALGPPGGADAPAQFRNLRLIEADLERARDGGAMRWV